MSRSTKPKVKLDHCWGCGTVTPFLCARCHKPVCCVVNSPTPDVGCARLRRVRGQVGVFRLVHFPRCVARRAPHVLAVVEKSEAACAVCGHTKGRHLQSCPSAPWR